MTPAPIMAIFQNCSLDYCFYHGRTCVHVSHCGRQNYFDLFSIHHWYQHLSSCWYYRFPDKCQIVFTSRTLVITTGDSLVTCVMRVWKLLHSCVTSVFIILLHTIHLSWAYYIEYWCRTFFHQASTICFSTTRSIFERICSQIDLCQAYFVSYSRMIYSQLDGRTFTAQRIRCLEIATGDSSWAIDLSVLRTIPCCSKTDLYRLAAH